MPEDHVFYIAVSWLVIIGIIALFILISCFIVIYRRRNTILKTEIDEVWGEVSYIKKQFDTHFKTTDKTIIDLRKERDFWKKRAERLD